MFSRCVYFTIFAMFLIGCGADETPEPDDADDASVVSDVSDVTETLADLMGSGPAVRLVDHVARQGVIRGTR